MSTCPTCRVPRPNGARYCAQCGAAFDPIGGSTAPTGPVSRLAAAALAVSVAGAAIGVAVVLERPGRVDVGSVPRASVTASASPAPVAATPELAGDPPAPTIVPTPVDRIALLGEQVAIFDETGDRLGWVRVTEAARYTSLRGLDAPSRWMWVGARMEYTADAGLGYADLDWIARDGAGTRYETTVFARDPILGLGVLGPGESAAGWVAFEVPNGVGHLWAAFVNLDGGIVFGVPLF
jgi:hypothetical protein